MALFYPNSSTAIRTLACILYPLVISHSYGRSPCLMGKSTISMAIFNSYVKLPEGTSRQAERVMQVGDSGYDVQSCHWAGTRGRSPRDGNWIRQPSLNG